MEQAQAISATDGVVGKLEQKAEEEIKTGQPVADTTTSSGRGTPAQGSSGDGEGQGEGEGGEDCARVENVCCVQRLHYM